MANFVCMVDPILQRRVGFLNHVRQSIAPLPGLRVEEISHGPFHALWACGEHTPIDHCEIDGQVAVVWGRPIPKDSVTPVRATDVVSAWADVGTAVPEPWDGYFAAVAYYPRREMVAGVDILGIVPMFWWSSGDVTLCATSPACFRHHPLFRTRLDRLGLTGILLTTHSLDGRTLLEDVHRLRQGNVLYASASGVTKELAQYRLPASTKHFDAPLEEHISLYDDALDQAIRRHVPAGTPHTLFMSGGIDSRMLGGFLARQGVPTTALTFGHPADNEMQCARSVASALHFGHRTAAADMDDGVTYAERHVSLLQASSGLNSIEYWGTHHVFDTMPKRFVAGYIIDAAISGYLGQRPYSKQSRTMSFDHFAPFAWDWGVAPNRLRRLLAFDDADELVNETVAYLRSTYEGYHELESRRYWAFVLNHRQRFHVGQLPWIFSFGAWPVIPACDQRVLEVAGGMPTVSLDERLVQVQMICRRFPNVARLPLDRNCMDNRPMLPDWKSLLKHRVQLGLRPYTQRLMRQREDRNYYQRVYDFNNPGWRQARRHAEPYRATWEGIFDMDVLRECLPDPDTTLTTTDLFAESSGPKTLLGLLLWARDYLGDAGASSPHARKTVRCTAAS